MRASLSLALVLVLVLLSCAPRTQGPAMWRLRDADSEIWILGTVHVLKPDVKWRGPRIDAALRNADVVWFETPTDAQAQAEIARLVATLGVNPPGVTLSSRLAPAQKAQLERVARSLDLDPARFEPARPWIVALQLSVLMLARQGADADSGVENVLEKEAARLGKKTAYFETAAQQMHILADLPPAAETAFLVATLRQIEEEADKADEMDALWARGDVEKLGALLNEMIAEAGPEAADALIHRRNTAWAAEIDTMMKGEGRIFIAVGAAHMTGAQGVPALLRAKGYAVEGP